MQFERRPLAAAIALLFSAPTWVGAQTAPEVVAQSTPGTLPTLPEVKAQATPEEPSFRTDVTRTGTRTETPLRDIPQFITIVPQSLIRSQNATTLQDALRNVPGISYAAAEGGTQANQVYYLRGFPLNQDIFIDAVRDIGEYNRDLFATETVEVLKGPSAVMFGRGSTGGVINQTTKVADRVQRGEVAVTLGSFDQKRATVDVNLRTTDSTALRLIGLLEDSDSYRYPRGVEKQGFAPSFWMNVGNATDLTFSFYYLKQKDVTDYGQPALFTNAAGFFGFPPVSPENYYGYANYDFADYETYTGTFRVDHRFDDSLTLRNVLRLANYKRESESTISTLSTTAANGTPVTPSTPLSLLLVTRNHDSGRTRDNDDTAFINQTELIWKAVTGSVTHNVLGGLELASERLDRRNYILDANPAVAGAQAPTSLTSFLNPDPYTTLSYTKTPNLDSVSKADTVAVYVQDQLELTPQWKALIGLRYEHYKSEARTDRASAVSAAAVGPFSRTDNMLSGRAGLLWQPSATQSYYASWGNSYNPSGELGTYGGTAATQLTAVNQNLEPEKNQNYEIGAQWDVITGLQLRAAIFRNEKTNARMPDPVSGVTILGGKRRVDGVEFEATGAITPNWEIYSGIAFMDGEIITGPANVQGNTPLGVSDVVGNIWTTYRFGASGWEIGGGLRGQKGAWLTDTNIPGSTIPSYVVADATVAYVQRQYEVRLNVTNLGDKVYYIGGYNNSPNRVLPGYPRSAAVTFRYLFL